MTGKPGLNGIIETAQQATDTAKSIMSLFEKNKKLIEESEKSTAAIITIHSFIQHHPITTTSKIKKKTQLSLPTILRSLDVLQALGIVKETTGKERNKIFAYTEYIGILNQGIEPNGRYG